MYELRALSVATRLQRRTHPLRRRHRSAVCFELCDFNYNGYLNQDETVRGLQCRFGSTNRSPTDCSRS